MPCLLPLLLLVVACGSPEDIGTRVIGHSGMGTGHSLAPNSPASITSALELGIDGVELDVQLSADGVLVTFHDERLEGSTACSGLVNSLPWDELRACAGSGPSKGTPSRLDSLLLDAAYRYPDADFTLDCKLFAQGDWWNYLEQYTDALVALEDLPLLRGRLLVECQVDPFLLLLQRKNEDIPLFRYDNDPEVATRRAVASHFAGITIGYSRISRAQVQHAQGLGLQVALFGPSGRIGHWLALRNGPDRLQTDAPELLAPR